MKCIAIRHLKFEDLGTFEEVLIEKGFEVDYVDAGVQKFDTYDWNATDLVVVLGGPIGVYEVSKYPWLKDEVDLIRHRLSQRLPTLGICLGAQVIAAALGATVYPNTAKEIGWSALQLCNAAKKSYLSTLDQVEVLHWHGDTFDLPHGATLLASTDITPHQAFSFGDNILALQFHPEVHGERLEPWLIGHTVELSTAKIDIPQLRQAGIRSASRKVIAGQKMFRQWLCQAVLS